MPGPWRPSEPERRETEFPQFIPQPREPRKRPSEWDFPGKTPDEVPTPQRKEEPMFPWIEPPEKERRRKKDQDPFNPTPDEEEKEDEKKEGDEEQKDDGNDDSKKRKKNRPVPLADPFGDEDEDEDRAGGIPGFPLPEMPEEEEERKDDDSGPSPSTETGGDGPSLFPTPDTKKRSDRPKPGGNPLFPM